MVAVEETYGEKMKRLRLALGLSQAEVAAIVGVAPQTINLWENGKRTGASSEAAQVPRRAINLLSQRLRHRRRKGGQGSTS